MSLFAQLHPLAFVLALGLGLLAVYAFQPPPRIVVRFPSPHNADRIVYRGADECYKVLADKVSCELSAEDKAKGVKVENQPVDGGDAKN